MLRKVWALQAATYWNQIENVQILLEHRAIMDEYTVLYAKSPEAFQLLLNHGLDIDHPVHFAHVPLITIYTYCAGSSQKAVGAIQANASSMATSGWALEVAAYLCDPIIVDTLIEYGASINNSCSTNCALIRKDTRILMMEHLVRRSADINRFGWPVDLAYGGTTLAFAAKHGLLEETRWMLDRSADIGIVDEYGDGALEHAKFKEH
ncbi:hypothetical protein ETB97_009828 [Aspergillus alliaceus]|uniref:Ankyrin repeat-containing domain protein n=1 Tax=Petromyces alliaceus TaxID=209559 RepID=A0A8H6E1E6_PETAA|nr:hypothetical protein ETB97_009828 [Aspergillus burnettii]